MGILVQAPRTWKLRALLAPQNCLLISTHVFAAVLNNDTSQKFVTFCIRKLWTENYSQNLRDSALYKALYKWAYLYQNFLLAKHGVCTNVHI